MRAVSGRLAEHLVARVDERLLLMVVGVIVGVCAGLAAVGLNRSIAFVEHFLHAARERPWAFAIPGLGAAASAIFLRWVVREGAGHGVPEVIFSVSRRGGRLRLRSSFSRLVSSCLTIGSGGSAGPEAPVVMSGSAIGSNVARALGLNERHRVILVGCGAAAAIAAIFNAPIAGMVFAMEVILGEWSRINIAPVAIASVAGAEISHVLQGNQIPFGPAIFTINTMDIVASAGLAVATALASILLTRLLRESHRVWERLPTPIWVRALLGGSIVGLLGLVLPVVLGEGYPAVRLAIGEQLEAGVLFVAVAVIAKMVATSMTIGSGGSGGIFAPSLLVGSLVGLAYHRLLVVAWPGHPWVGEGCFALLGMAGLISGILQAPLTGIFLIFEITGGWSVILPLIVVSVVSSAVCNRVEPGSFYVRDLMRKGQLLRPGTDARVLADIRVSELLELDCVTVGENQLLRDFVNVVKSSHRNWFPVIGPDRVLLGMIHLDEVRPYLFSPEIYDAVVLGELMDPAPVTVTPDDNLDEVLDTMDRIGAFSLPVVAGNRFIGMISKATLLDQYRKELIVQTDS